jgi:hypothetical protein
VHRHCTNLQERPDPKRTKTSTPSELLKVLVTSTTSTSTLSSSLSVSSAPVGSTSDRPKPKPKRARISKSKKLKRSVKTPKVNVPSKQHNSDVDESKMEQQPPHESVKQNRGNKDERVLAAVAQSKREGKQELLPIVASSAPLLPTKSSRKKAIQQKDVHKQTSTKKKPRGKNSNTKVILRPSPKRYLYGREALDQAENVCAGCRGSRSDELLNDPIIFCDAYVKIERLKWETCCTFSHGG